MSASDMHSLPFPLCNDSGVHTEVRFQLLYAAPHRVQGRVSIEAQIPSGA